MGELKSARDIAVARTAGMQPLSVEERQKLRREELRIVGRAMVDRYLSAGDLRMLAVSSAREDKSASGVVRTAALERLLEGLVDGSDVKFERIEAGLKVLAGNSYPAFARELQVFLASVKKLDEEAVAEAEAEARGQLVEVGVGGSAVAGVNPRAWPAWERIAREKAPLLKEGLDSLMLAATGWEG